MSLIGLLHESKIHGRRIGSLRRHLVSLIPEHGIVLDVGCGDGQLAGLLDEALPHAFFRGMDVLVRPQTAIPVERFDGVTIPMPDNSVDTVMMVDVLHHTEDPQILMREAKRVASKWIVLKDHTRDGLFANTTLRFMDWIGNARHGVALPYNYLSGSEWDKLFEQIDVKVDQWIANPRLYGRPGDWVFGRSLHFLARLAVQ